MENPEETRYEAPKILKNKSFTQKQKDDFKL